MFLAAQLANAAVHWEPCFQNQINFTLQVAAHIFNFEVMDPRLVIVIKSGGEGRGSYQETFHGGVWIFSGTTQIHLRITALFFSLMYHMESFYHRAQCLPQGKKNFKKKKAIRCFAGNKP